MLASVASLSSSSSVISFLLAQWFSCSSVRRLNGIICDSQNRLTSSTALAMFKSISVWVLPKKSLLTCTCRPHVPASCDVNPYSQHWSSYKASRSALKGLGYTKCFLPYNTRATNAYRRCAYLAYTVNVFADVDTQLYFNNRGYTVDSDKLAISEMVQWLWRSRLRDGKEIWLYLPSSRMRKLLYKWVKDVTGSVDCIDEWE